jgi:hypothetical protein
VKMRMLNKYLETKACRLIQGMRFWTKSFFKVLTLSESI